VRQLEPRLTPSLTTLGSFLAPNGVSPYAGLVMDNSGNLYGTTSGAGASGYGTVFEIAHGSGTLTTLASFGGTNGADPRSALILDSNGNLYGATVGGGASNDGTVFELAAGSGTITALASFNGTDGANPHGALIMDSSGNLYGTTEAGGASGDGTVFEVAAGSGTITTLASFNGTDGANPYGTLVMDSSGNLYGTTFYGGASSDGTVFEVAAGSGTITTLASFNGTDGADPEAGLVMDSSGNLYGMTYRGGASGDGTVFEVAAGSGTITTLASFDGTNGQWPDGGLVMDGSGNLYGTTAVGGARNAGTIFELAQGSGTITTLASFTANTNGMQPDALVTDGSGNLYGTTLTGQGSTEFGTVFRLGHGRNTIQTVAVFDDFNGFAPNDLIVSSSGVLYGTTEVGTVFAVEVINFQTQIVTLAVVGGLPNSLLMDSSGDLYGTTWDGGAYRDGSVFELVNGSNTISTLASFSGTDGSEANALIKDSSGNLYGTTSSGGAGGLGSVFELPGAAVPIDQWTGANFAVDTNWSDGANWSLGVPPDPGQTAQFTNNATVKSFTATVDAGFTSAIGVLDIDSTWGGTITVNSPLTVTGNFTLASGNLGGSGAVTIGGSASTWTGGQIDLGSGGLTNTGTLTADTTAGNLVLTGAGTLTNNGTINEAGTNSLVLENTATLDNAGGGTFDLTANGGLSQSGGGTFTNAGTVEKTGGTGTSTIASATLSNTGTVEVASGTVDISAAVTQVSGKTLAGGIWTISGSSTVHAKLDITSAGSFTTLGAGAQVTLDGLHTGFTNLKGLRTIDAGASFSLLGGQSFTTAGALTNKGSLTLAPGSVLTVSGNFTQASTGTLTIELGGTNKSPTFGQLVSATGTVALAGSLDVTSTAVPAVGSAFELLDNEGDASISGMFKGLSEGATFKVTAGTTTMKFKITYGGKDADGKKNVVIRRTS
jgi:uncharacterized repeat protein (TIGR03803 family)